MSDRLADAVQPIRSVWVPASPRLSVNSLIRRSAMTTDSASSRILTPIVVGTIRWRERTSTSKPSRPSITFMLRVRAGCVRPSVSAARVKEPVRMIS